MVAFSVLFIVINDYLLVTRGPTLAKWMLGIRIVDYATGATRLVCGHRGSKAR